MSDSPYDVPAFSVFLEDGELSKEQLKLIDDGEIYLRGSDLAGELSKSDFCCGLIECGSNDGVVKFRQRYHLELALQRARRLRDRLNVFLNGFPQASYTELKDDE